MDGFVYNLVLGTTSLWIMIPALKSPPSWQWAIAITCAVSTLMWHRKNAVFYYADLVCATLLCTAMAFASSARACIFFGVPLIAFYVTCCRCASCSASALWNHICFRNVGFWWLYSMCEVLTWKTVVVLQTLYWMSIVLLLLLRPSYPCGCLIVLVHILFANSV
jgi:hypothetical protein